MTAPLRVRLELAYALEGERSAEGSQKGSDPEGLTLGQCCDDPPVIAGVHTLIFAEDAEAARAFFRDVLGFPHVEAHPGLADLRVTGR